MKITCQSCQAKYTIADEKVAGKTVKIKCKKCGSTIVVSGIEAAAPAPAAAYPGLPPMDDDGATRVVSIPEAGGAPTTDEWTVNISDDDQRTMTTSQVAQGYASGTITGDTYLWRDGMSDWLPLSGIPELAALVSRPGPAAGGEAPGQAMADDETAGMPDNASTVAFAQSPFNQPGAMQAFVAAQAASKAAPAAAPAPVESAPAAAARRASAGRSGVDLFGGSSEQRAGAGDMFPSPNAPSHDDRLVGERNENSVLFSLSSLTASDNANKAARGGGNRDDAVIDMRPSPGAGPGRRDVDDIMNLGGGGFASPILAPPSLLAPVIEPPPQMAPVGMSASLPAQAFGGMSAPPEKKSSMVGLIAGVALGIVLVGGAAIYFLRPAPPPAVAANDAVSASAQPSAVVAAAATPTAVPSAAAVAAAAPTDSPSAAPTGAAAVAVAAAAPGKGTDKPAGAAPGPGAAPSPAATAAKPEKTAEPAAAATAAPAPAAGGAEFNRGAASSALGGAAGAAKSCKKPDGPTGTGRVKVTFAPSGRVTSAVVEGPPFAGTSVGGCVASAFRGAHIPPFDGAPVAVSKSFTIN